MKVAIIIRKLNVRGGVQRHVLFLARKLQKLGHLVKIYTFVYSPDDCYKELLDGLDVVALGQAPKFKNYFSNIFIENRACRKLADLIDKDVDILNPHDHAMYKVSYYFKKNVKNIPSVWVMHDMPTKLWNFWRDSQCDSSLKISFFKKIAYKLTDLYNILKFIKKQDRIVVLDNRDKEWVKQYFNKDAIVVRNGLSVENFPYMERQPLAGKRINILMQGIFFPHRRFEDGIEAVKLLRERNYDVALFVVGDYSINERYRQKLANLVSGLGLEGVVKFIGSVSEDDLKRFYKQSDIFVFPNHLQSWGLAVFEAMASGLPVIVSKTAGASEILTDRENAILIEPKSPGEIAAAAQELIDKPELYIKLSREGRSFVEGNISWAEYATNMLRVFNSLL